MKIQTFTVKATVKNGEIILKPETKKMTSEGEGTDFEEKDIPRKAQEISEFNRTESDSIKGMGDGEYTIEHKLIV